MAMTNAYLTVDELKDLQRDMLAATNTEYERAIEAASRTIDLYCGRQFWKPSAPTVKTFKANSVELLWTRDIANTTGLIVKTDDDQDGTYETTWTINTDFILEPFERMNGRPYERIAAVGDKEFPVAGLGYNAVGRTRVSRRPLVQITATWGWDAVPDEVMMACSIAAVDNLKAKDLTHVAATYGNEVRVARDFTPGMHGRKVKFSRLRSPMLNPQAEALISGLRLTAIA